MKKKNLTEGLVDIIYKALSKGKYSQVQKKFKAEKELQAKIKKAEIARRDLAKSIDKFRKSHGNTKAKKSNDKFWNDLEKQYGK